MRRQRMDLQKRLELNPMVTIDTALKILAHSSVVYLGLELSESYCQAYDRYNSAIYNIMISNDSITKEFNATDTLADNKIITFKVDRNHIDEYGIRTDVSDVNILQLLEHYNESLKKYGKDTIALSVQHNTSKSYEDSVTAKDVCELANCLADTVTNIVSRDDKLKVETFEQILSEATIGIKNDTFIKAIPEIKQSYRKKFDKFITKGRLSLVTVKKIEAAIQLMGNYMDTKKIPERKTMILNLGGFNLPKPDREQVVDVFINRIKNPSTT